MAFSSSCIQKLQFYFAVKYRPSVTPAKVCPPGNWCLTTKTKKGSRGSQGSGERRRVTSPHPLQRPPAAKPPLRPQGPWKLTCDHNRQGCICLKYCPFGVSLQVLSLPFDGLNYVLTQNVPSMNLNCYLQY